MLGRTIPLVLLASTTGRPLVQGDTPYASAGHPLLGGRLEELRGRGVRGVGLSPLRGARVEVRGGAPSRAAVPKASQAVSGVVDPSSGREVRRPFVTAAPGAAGRAASGVSCPAKVA